MFVVGLTGGIGSGKSQAATIFAELGVPVVDTDVIAHRLTTPHHPTLALIANTFGQHLIQGDGALDRPALRKIVFADRAAKSKLEAILHPLILDQAKLALEAQAHHPYQILVVPLLFESKNYSEIINRSLVIDCDESLQIQRTMQRSNLSEDEVRAIMATQLSREQRNALADDVINNNDTPKSLALQIQEIHKKFIYTCIVSE